MLSWRPRSTRSVARCVMGPAQQVTRVSTACGTSAGRERRFAQATLLLYLIRIYIYSTFYVQGSLLAKATPPKGTREPARHPAGHPLSPQAHTSNEGRYLLWGFTPVFDRYRSLAAGVSDPAVQRCDCVSPDGRVPHAGWAQVARPTSNTPEVSQKLAPDLQVATGSSGGIRNESFSARSIWHPRALACPPNKPMPPTLCAR
jgi:hypothetical protein